MCKTWKSVSSLIINNLLRTSISEHIENSYILCAFNRISHRSHHLTCRNMDNVYTCVSRGVYSCLAHAFQILLYMKLYRFAVCPLPGKFSILLIFWLVKITTEYTRRNKNIVEHLVYVLLFINIFEKLMGQCQTSWNVWKLQRYYSNICI